MTIDHNFRRDRIKWVIDRDPWTCEYQSRGDTGEDASTSGSFTCRFFPSAGYRGASRGLGVLSGHSSEVASGLILAEWDAPELKYGDLCTLTHEASGIVRTVSVSFPRRVGYKWEIEVDEVG